MKTNVGETDRMFRIIVAVVLFSLALVAPAEWRWLALLGLLPLATGVARVCPLYTILGMTTCDKETQHVQKHPGSD
jgi:hypothetical protein